MTRFMSSRIGKQIVRTLISGSLFAILAMLVLVPFMMVVYTSLTDAAPFSGNPHLKWTFANYKALWSPELRERSEISS